MTHHSRPEYTAPDDERCCALVRGHPSWVFEWMRHDHRCPRRANQAVGTHLLCWQHAQMREVRFWCDR